MTTDALLRVEGLRKAYPVKRGILIERVVSELNAVDGVSFTLEEGKTLGIVGESGAGKSTVGYCVLQLIRPTAGSVIFMGKELTVLSGSRLRQMRREMQIVFQDPYSSLNPRMTVGATIREPLDVHGVGEGGRSRQARVDELLELVGAHPGMASRYPHEISSGQRQRIAIARALALGPRLVICDEPVSALDVSIQAQILNLLKDLQDQLGLSYLFVSHDLAVVRTMSDEIAVMKNGKIVEMGPAETIVGAPAHEHTRALLAAVVMPDPRRMRARQDATASE